MAVAGHDRAGVRDGMSFATIPEVLAELAQGRPILLVDDPDRENVTVINMGGTSISLDGWRLVDKNDHQFAIQGVTLAGGSAATLTLRKETAQLSNQGGEIRLINANNEVIHRVSYSKQQASREGETLIF